MKKIYLLATGLSLLSVIAFSQEKASKSSKIEQRHLKESGEPIWISLKENTNYKMENGSTILKEFLLDDKNFSNRTLEDHFIKIKSENDKLGYSHDTYQQYVGNLKVEFANFKIHGINGRIVSMNGDFFEINPKSLTPSISAEQGLQKAMQHLGAEKYLWEYPEAAREMDNYKKPQGELVVLSAKIIGTSQDRLAYKYDIYSTKPIGRGDVYVDAENGKVLFYNAIIKHAEKFGHIGEVNEDEHNHAIVDGHEREALALAPMVASGTAYTRYSGAQTITTASSNGSYILADSAKKIYTRNANNQETTGYPYVSNYTQFSDNDNLWSTSEWNNNNKDNAALDAHWGATKTYDYFLEKHSRNSYDNNGAQIRSYVHVGTDYDNAFWNGSVMSYGDGSSNGNEGNGFFDALTSLDVAAHEIGHAICSSTANLVYQKEPGAMNEGFSDIWAAAVEYYAAPNDPNKDTWLVGEEIDRRTGSVALRSMSNPNERNQPDTYGGTYWINVNCSPSRSNDYCGVHTNSGVLNHWFYILTEGKSGTNDNGDNYSVTGIGMDKAADIAYRLESVYLSSSSSFANARTYGIQAAKDLYGDDSDEEIAVTNAWYAVGVGEAYAGGGNGGGSDDCYNEVELSITFDNYPQETSWELKDANGTVIDSQQYSTSNPDGSTVTKTFNNLADGNYTFTIKDSYGDGMCCSYGNGSYSLKSGSNTIKTGGEYGSAESTSFCIGGTAVDTEAPSAPTSLTYSNVTTTTADLSWNASTDNVGVTEYQIFQGASNLGTVNGTEANITGMSPATSYTFSIKAVDEAGNVSSASNNVTFTTLSDTTNPNCYDNVSLSITLDRYPRETSWTLKNSTGTTVASKSAGSYTSANTTVTESFSGLSAGDYTFTISDSYGDGICCSYGNGSYTLKSGAVTIKTGSDFGSSESTEFCANGTNSVDYSFVNQGDEQTIALDILKISPNPAKEIVKFNLIDAKSGATYEVFDQTGNIVLRGDLSDEGVNVSKLSTGAYIVKVYHGNEIHTKKMIKK